MKTIENHINEKNKGGSHNKTTGAALDRSGNGEALTALEAPNVFLFDDYRLFLSQWFDWKKRVQRGYSGAVFAKSAGLSSHSLLGMVIRGNRNLSAKTIRAFCRALSLKGQQALYFEKLVLFNQSGNSEDKAYYLDQLVSVSGGNGKTILTKIKNHARFLSHWYVVAVRELVDLTDFKADPEWISRKLKRKITKRQAREAWEILLELGMVAKNPASGRFEPQELGIDIDPGVIDFAIRNFHKQFLERTKDAVDNDPFGERELSSLTISISKEDLPVLQKKIKDFRRDLNLSFPVSQATPDRVVAVNTQLLVLTE